MTKNTELALIDAVNSALKTRNKAELKNAANLVRIKCHQSETNILEFLFDRVFVVCSGLETDKSDFHCPYCNVPYNGIAGLKTHISRKHPECFGDWKRTIKSQIYY